MSGVQSDFEQTENDRVVGLDRTIKIVEAGMTAGKRAVLLAPPDFTFGSLVYKNFRVFKETR